MPASLPARPSDELLARLEAIARRAAEAEGVQVAWVEFKPQGGSPVFRVFIEREDGRVGLADCERVTGRLGLLLDVEDPIESSYVLEVSTPGLDRPLRDEADYHRFAGRLARIKTRAPLEGKRRFVGRLGGTESGTVLLEDRERGVLSIPWTLIESGRLEVEFGSPAASPRRAVVGGGRPRRPPAPRTRPHRKPRKRA